MELFYQNEYGQRIDLVNDRRFALTGQTGLVSLPSNVLSTSDTVLTEGETVLWRKRSARQITMTHQFLHDVTEARREFVRILDQGAAGRLIYRDLGMNVFIEVEVEDCEVKNTDKVTTAQTTFVASYPYFQDMEQQTAGNRGVTGGWRFPFTFPVTFGTVTANDSIIIENMGNFQFGFVADIDISSGYAKDLQIVSHTGESIVLRGYWGVIPEELQDSAYRGDVTKIRIDTRAGNKSVTNLDTGESLLGYFSVESKMLQIQRGTNVFTVTAETGIENVSVLIAYRNVYKGV